jgi:hypothetical protein
MERQYGAWSDQVHGREMAYYGIKYPLALFWVGALMAVWVVGTGPDGLMCSGGREVGGRQSRRRCGARHGIRGDLTFRISFSRILG